VLPALANAAQPHFEIAAKTHKDTDNFLVTVEA
jgi:hypothetical protein